jgi:cell division protein FtsI (penicillin-binding protein 3)
MSIGYETQIPPISTLTFYNAIANNGVMVRPRLVKSIVKDGETIDENPVEVLIPQIAKPKTIEEIQTILERVVSEGLGRQAGSKQFHVSGKTGTAQVSQGKSGYTNGMRRYLVSFCGYFPSESPKYSCIVAIQKNGLPASGGGMAGPVFRNIAERVYAKHLAQDLMNAKDSTSVLIPDVKRGNIEAANYVLRQIDVPTTGYSDGLLNTATSWLGGKAEQKELPQWGNVEEDTDRVAFQQLEIKPTVVPNVVGMGAKDAVFLVESLGLQARIVGVGRVRAQSIPAGNTLVKGQTIQLRLK